MENLISTIISANILSSTSAFCEYTERGRTGQYLYNRQRIEKEINKHYRIEKCIR